jgi:hypothetical protein
LTSLPKNLFSNNTGLQFLRLGNNKLNAIYQTTFSNLKNFNQLWLRNNPCINVDFNAPINSTVVADALVKCDVNANTCADSNSFIKEQLKTVATMLASMANTMANVSSILTSITNNL